MFVAVCSTFLSLFATLGGLCDRALRFRGSLMWARHLPRLSGAAVDPVHPVTVVGSSACSTVRWRDPGVSDFLVPFCTWLLIGYFKSIL
jgi:hypothetical protein